MRASAVGDEMRLPPSRRACGAADRACSWGSCNGEAATAGLGAPRGAARHAAVPRRAARRAGARAGRGRAAALRVAPFSIRWHGLGAFPSAAPAARDLGGGRRRARASSARLEWRSPGGSGCCWPARRLTQAEPFHPHLTLGPRQDGVEARADWPAVLEAAAVGEVSLARRPRLAVSQPRIAGRRGLRGDRARVGSTDDGKIGQPWARHYSATSWVRCPWAS